MKKKLLIAILTTSTVAVALALAATPNNAVTSFAEGCEHEGNHYDAVAATSTSAGNKEFWACCVCHEQFITEPSKGTWEDKGAYTGVLAPSHVAYVAPVKLQGTFIQVANASSEYIDSIDIVEGSTYNVGETVRIRLVPKTLYSGVENISKFYLDVDGVRQTLVSASGAFSVDYVVTEGEHRIVGGYLSSSSGSSYTLTVTDSEHISIHGVTSGNKYTNVALDVVRIPGYRATFQYSTNGGSSWTTAILSFTNNVAHWERSGLTSNLAVRVTETYVGAYTLSFAGGSDVKHNGGTFANRLATAGDSFVFENVESISPTKYVSGATSSDVSVSFTTSYNISSLKFTMPSKNVTVTFNFANYVTYTVNSTAGALDSYAIVDNPNNSNSVVGLRAGQTYYFRATVNDGYSLAGIKINNGELLTPNMELNNAVEFTCPTSNFTIEVVTNESYTVNVNYYEGWNETHGSVSIMDYYSGVHTNEFKPGDWVKVVFYPSTSNGYELDYSSVSATGASMSFYDTNTYVFQMPSNNVTISFRFNSTSAPDVNPGDAAEVPSTMTGNWIDVFGEYVGFNITSDNCAVTPNGGSTINCAFTGTYGGDWVYNRKSVRFASADESLVIDVSLDYSGSGVEVYSITDTNNVIKAAVDNFYGYIPCRRP
ncbi:MAG: hypothetical protein MJ248_00110 [Bacilli bacterium]|nr:hypothetical protein [Bacilli bacterium]